MFFSSKESGIFQVEEIPSSAYKLINNQLKIDETKDSWTLFSSESKSSENKASPAITADTSEPQKKAKQQKAAPNKTSVQTNWTKFNIHSILENSLISLNFVEPTEIQLKSLPNALKGDTDILGSAVTGSGKTLAFGLPVLNYLLTNPPKVDDKLSALILSPTRELALQICEQLNKVIFEINKQAKEGYFLKKILPIVGGISEKKQQRFLRSKPEVVVATPGRFSYFMKQDFEHINSLITSLRFFIVDEADRLFLKGQFPDLKPIIRTLDERFSQVQGSKARQTFMFSATLMKISSETISPLLELTKNIGIQGDPIEIDLTSGLNDTGSTSAAFPEQLKLFHHQVPDTMKIKHLFLLLEKYKNKKILVFVNAIHILKNLVQIFTLLKLESVIGLHANMMQRQRLKNLDRFKSGQKKVLIATDVAARGLDVCDIDVVIQFHVPKNQNMMETFVHRCGRTARAGRSGISITFVSPKEKVRFDKDILCGLEGVEITSMKLNNAEGKFLDGVGKRVSLAKKLAKNLYEDEKMEKEALWREEKGEKLEMVLEDGDAEEEMNREVGRKMIEKLERELRLELVDNIGIDEDQEENGYGNCRRKKSFVTVNADLIKRLITGEVVNEKNTESKSEREKRFREGRIEKNKRKSRKKRRR
eukprot:snap_masked-scaffold_2-processed-gene-11.29-mRNA-1 protein AED:0.12 eAED:0.12 QI:0/0/0/1/1/1/2/0/648